MYTYHDILKNQGSFLKIPEIHIKLSTNNDSFSPPRTFLILIYDKFFPPHPIFEIVIQISVPGNEIYISDAVKLKSANNIWQHTPLR